MKTVDQQLFDLIEEQEHFELVTSKGITISTRDEHSLNAEFTLVNTEEANLDVSFYCDKKEFVKTLDIRNLTDIYDLTPGRLMEVFQEGLAQLVCFVALEYSYAMEFQKLGNTIIAVNERGIKHKIPLYEKLEAPDQFITYAKRYYTLMECNEN